MYTLLWLGGGQSEPYSCTCMPKKHTSVPSMSSNAKRAFNLYGKDSAISPLSTNLKRGNKKNELREQVMEVSLMRVLHLKRTGYISTNNKMTTP